MPEPFHWRVSELPEGHHLMAYCRRCQGHRYLPRALLLEKAGDVPVNTIQPRLRCIERGRDKRGPRCDGAMDLDWLYTPQANRPSDQL